MNKGFKVKDGKLIKPKIGRVVRFTHSGLVAGTTITGKVLSYDPVGLASDPHAVEFELVSMDPPEMPVNEFVKPIFYNVTEYDFEWCYADD